MKGRVVWGLGAVTIALAGFAISTVARSIGEDHDALGKEFARARRLGLPEKMADLWPPPNNPAQNAAPLYTALTHSHTLSRARSIVEKVGYPANPAQIRTLAGDLAPYASEYAAWEKAARMKECRFQRIPSKMVMLPEYAAMKSAAIALSGRARLESVQGDPLKAMRTLGSAARISAHARKEPMLIPALVSVSCEITTLKTLQEVLTDGGRRADVRAAARRVLADLGVPPDGKTALRGEWSFQQSTVDELASGRMPVADLFKYSASSPQSLSGSGVAGKIATLISLKTPMGLARQRLQASRIFLDYYEAVPESPDQLAAAERAVKAMEAAALPEGDTLLSSILLSEVGGFHEVLARAVAERRVVAALLNALDAPIPPATLPAQGREAIDPFTDEPLRYAATPTEIRVWSVGTDRKDDGGLPASAARKPDITALWPCPKANPLPSP